MVCLYTHLMPLSIMLMFQYSYNVVSTRNIAKTANFLFHFLRGYIGTLRINKTTSSMANYLLVPDITQDSVGLKFYYGVMNPSAQVPIINHTLLLISNSKFHDNTGGSVSIHVYKGYNNVKCQVIVEKCLLKLEVV